MLLRILSLLTLIVVNVESSSLAAMAIDIGSQFTKIGVVKPGIPMDIALNRESRRKTATMVAIDGEQRSFGDPATQLATKNPSKAFQYLLDLLGKKTDHPAVQAFTRRYPIYNIVPDEARGTVVFKVGDGESAKLYSVESLIAMFLRECKAIAELYAEQKISDAVITVPAFFNQAERRAMSDAADLAGIKMLQLMNDNTAAGLNYGMFRRKIFNESATTLLLFDMGASKTTATVFEYQVVKDKQTGAKNPQMTTLGFGFDRTLGGSEMSQRVQKHLLSLFKSSTKTEKTPEDTPRAMAKLLKEAERVKQVLSANTETFAQIENVMEDRDFKHRYTRDDLDALIGDLFERVAKPVQDALKMAELSPKQIDTVVLMGGGTRVVGVQNALQKALDGAELGKFINTDEAAALGAVYQAAHLTKGFKVAKFNVKDTAFYPIQVDFAKEGQHESESIDDAAADKRMIHRTLFASGNAYPMKKVMTFNKHTHDFEFAVNYGDLRMLGKEQLMAFGELNVTRVDVIGLKDAYDKAAEDKLAEWKGVKVHFKMDDSGILIVDSAEALVEHQPDPEAVESTLSSFGKKLGSLFSSAEEKKEGGGEEKKDEERKENDEQTTTPPPTQEDAPPTEKPTETTDAPKVNETGKREESKKNETKAAKKDDKPRQEKIALTLQQKHMDLPELSAEVKTEIRAVMSEFDERERAKVKREAAMNNLESFIIDMRMKFDDDGDLQSYASTDDRSNIMEQLNAAQTWFDDDAGFDTPTEDFETRLKDLKKLTKDAEYRKKQSIDRPQALEAMKQIFNHSELFLNFMKINSTGPEDERIFTDVEISTLEKMYNDTKTWWEEKQAAQAKLSDHEDPAYTLVQVGDKVQLLDRELKYMINKMKLYKPKNKKNETDSKTDENKTSEEDVKLTKEGDEEKTTDEEKRKDEQSTSDSKGAENIVLEEASEDDEKPTDEPVSEEPEVEADQEDRRHDEF